MGKFDTKMNKITEILNQVVQTGNVNIHNRYTFRSNKWIIRPQSTWPISLQRCDLMTAFKLLAFLEGNAFLMRMKVIL